MESREIWTKSFTTPRAQPDDLSFCQKEIMENSLTVGQDKREKSGKMKVETSGHPVE